MKQRQNPLQHRHGKLREIKASHEEWPRPTGFVFVQADRIDYLQPS